MLKIILLQVLILFYQFTGNYRELVRLKRMDRGGVPKYLQSPRNQIYHYSTNRIIYFNLCIVPLHIQIPFKK